jgi:protein SCO1/2
VTGSTRLAKIALSTVLLTLAMTLLIITFDNQRSKRQVSEYQLPDVTLIKHTGEAIRLIDYLATDKPLILEFIFTGCTTVCPVMMVKFANLQRRLEPDTEQVLMVSISIDPENDTPEVLTRYREQYQARPGWDFLTGSVADISKVMAAFNTRPTDMATLDTPLLLRAPGSKRWVRLTGNIDNRTFWSEYQELLIGNQ